MSTTPSALAFALGAILVLFIGAMALTVGFFYQA
jgi:hypothetical protein